VIRMGAMEEMVAVVGGGSASGAEHVGEVLLQRAR
jgi:hypothetical protein